MDIGLAHTLAGACSLGALYNLGRALVGSSGPSKIYDEEMLDQDLSVAAGKPIESSEEEIPLSPEETQELIDSLEMSAYLKGMLTATHFRSSSNRIQSLVYAIGLGSIAYLLLQNQSQSDQIQSLTSQIGHCQAKIHPHTAQRLRLDSLKPHPDSFFFSEASYRIINFMKNTPIEASCFTAGEAPKENCKYMIVKISDENVCMEYCAQTEVNLQDKNTLVFTANPVHANDSFVDQVRLSITEQFETVQNQLKITSVCNGFFNASQPISFESTEVISGQTSGYQSEAPSQVGAYTAKEKVGSRENSVEKIYYLENLQDLDIKPFDNDQALPWLQRYLSNPSAHALQTSLNK